MSQPRLALCPWAPNVFLPGLALVFFIRAGTCGGLPGLGVPGIASPQRAQHRYGTQSKRLRGGAAPRTAETNRAREAHAKRGSRNILILAGRVATWQTTGSARHGPVGNRRKQRNPPTTRCLAWRTRDVTPKGSRRKYFTATLRVEAAAAGGKNRSNLLICRSDSSVAVPGGAGCRGWGRGLGRAGDGGCHRAPPRPSPWLGAPPSPSTRDPSPNPARSGQRRAEEAPVRPPVWCRGDPRSPPLAAEGIRPTRAPPCCGGAPGGGWRRRPLTSGGRLTQPRQAGRQPACRGAGEAECSPDLVCQLTTHLTHTDPSLRWLLLSSDAGPPNSPAQALVRRPCSGPLAASRWHASPPDDRKSNHPRRAQAPPAGSRRN